MTTTGLEGAAEESEIKENSTLRQTARIALDTARTEHPVMVQPDDLRANYGTGKPSLMSSLVLAS